MHVEAYECLYPGENDISYIIFMQDNVFIDMLSSQLIGNHRYVGKHDPLFGNYSDVRF